MLSVLGIFILPVITLATNGCTDSTKFNYNPAATTDDNSCIDKDVMYKRVVSGRCNEDGWAQPANIGECAWHMSPILQSNPTPYRSPGCYIQASNDYLYYNSYQTAYYDYSAQRVGVCIAKKAPVCRNKDATQAVGNFQTYDSSGTPTAWTHGCRCGIATNICSTGEYCDANNDACLIKGCTNPKKVN